MDERDLITAARTARQCAYAPYSSFAVGAALLDADGRTFVGCNVENVSFGLTMCAERVAVGSAVAAGATNFDAIAVVSDSAEPVVPCGACRQVLAEFSPSLRVISATINGSVTEFSLASLLPSPRQGILG
jgi:cytidine deaminase